MIRLEIREWEPRSGVNLTPDQVASLAGSSAFELSPDPTNRGCWTVRAQRYVGVAQFGDLEIRVSPKVPAGRLVSLLLWSQHRITWDDTATPELADVDDLVTLLAGAFCAEVERVLRQGLVQGYRRVEDALPTVRGRILAGAQMSRRSGLPLPVELAFDEYTLDVTENQLIAGAVRVLSGVAHIDPGLRTRLRRIERVLVGVEPTRPSSRPPDVTFTRLNDRYRAAVALARIALRGAALDVTGERAARGTGFLIDMDKVFEDVVGQGMRTAVELAGDRLDLQLTGSLDEGERLSIRLDLARLRAGEVVAIGDVKYRDPAKRDINHDVYQVLAYAHRFGLDHVHLVYAAPPMFSEARVGGVTVHLHSVDLSVPRTELLDRLARLADSFAPTSSADT